MLTVKKQREFGVRSDLMNYLCLNRTGENPFRLWPYPTGSLYSQHCLSYVTDNHTVIALEDGRDDWELQVHTYT